LIGAICQSTPEFVFHAYVSQTAATEVGRSDSEDTLMSFDLGVWHTAKRLSDKQADKRCQSANLRCIPTCH